MRSQQAEMATVLWPSLKAGRTTAGLRSDACVCFAPVVGNPIRLVREANSRKASVS